jgi:hypothetical protein
VKALRGLLIAAGLGILGVMSLPAPQPGPPPTGEAPALKDPDLATPSGFPPVGKWMYDPTWVPAHWLGEIYRGKGLREPINVLVVDGLAASVQDARQRFVVACQKAGYPPRTGHSTGYHGYIGGAWYGQLPEEKDHAFSNEPFELDNNHGRVFGPAAIEGKYYFTAAFSRENVDPFTRVKHLYGSFDQARDDFAQRMDEHTGYKIADFIDLDNALIGNPTTSTGDHDGVAVLLVAQR